MVPRILSHLSVADWLRRAGPCQKFTNPKCGLRGVFYCVLQVAQGLYQANSSPRSPTSSTAAESLTMPTINVDKYALFEELGEQ